MNSCEMFECIKCKKELNIQQIKKCDKSCNSFRCNGWFCGIEMYIDNNGDLKQGHNKKCILHILK